MARCKQRYISREQQETDFDEDEEHVKRKAAHKANENINNSASAFSTETLEDPIDREAQIQEWRAMLGVDSNDVDVNSAQMSHERIMSYDSPLAFGIWPDPKIEPTE